jgi:hypothetical protein
MGVQIGALVPIKRWLQLQATVCTNVVIFNVYNVRPWRNQTRSSTLRISAYWGDVDELCSRRAFLPMDPKPTFHNFSNLNPNEAPASPTRLLVSCCRSGLPKKRNGPVIMVKKALLPQHQGHIDGTCAVYSVLKRLHAAVRSFGKAG